MLPVSERAYHGRPRGPTCSRKRRAGAVCTFALNTAASAQRPAAAHAAPSAAFALGRPRPVHLALSSLPPYSGCNEHRQARDCRTLASQGFYGLLAMEIPLAWGPAADRPRGARADPKNEF